MEEVELWCVEEKARIEDKHDQVGSHLKLAKKSEGRLKMSHLHCADVLMNEINRRLPILNQKLKEI